MQIPQSDSDYQLLRLNKFSKIVAAQYPIDWKSLGLGEPVSGTFSNGINKEKESYGKGTLFVNILDVFREFTINPKLLKRVEVSEDEIESYSLQRGDIILDRSSNIFETVGYPAYFDGFTEPVVFSGFTFRYRPNKNSWDSRFLAYMLMSSPIRKLVVSIATKSANSNVNQESYKRISVPCPPIREQQKIASILSKVDDLIQKTEEIIEATQRLKRGLMQKLFTRGIRNTRFKSIRFLFGKEIEIPSDWNIVKLVEMCKGKPEYGAAVAAIKYDPSLPRYIRITDITDEGSLTKEVVSISRDDAKNFILSEGDILFARTGATVGKTYLYNKEDGQCAFAGYLIKFIPDEERLDPKFLFHYTHSYNYWRWLLSNFTQGVQPNVNAEQYSHLPLLTPSIKEQRKIAQTMDVIDGNIKQHLNYKKQVELLKKGLMQKLLTGQIRVKV